MVERRNLLFSERNVINGMPDGNFIPYGNLTRAQAAKIIATAIGAKVDPNAKPSYNDAKNSWAASFNCSHGKREYY